VQNRGELSSFTPAGTIRAQSAVFLPMSGQQEPPCVQQKQRPSLHVLCVSLSQPGNASAWRRLGRTSVFQIHKRVFALSHNKGAAADVYERLLSHILPVYCRARGKVSRKLFHHIPQALCGGNRHPKHWQTFYLPKIGTSFHLWGQLVVLASCTMRTRPVSKLSSKRQSSAAITTHKTQGR
jgi:hypothetical protein